MGFTMELKILILVLRVRSIYVLQLMECSSCLAGAYFYVCVRSSQFVDDAAKIGEVFHFKLRLVEVYLISLFAVKSVFSFRALKEALHE